MISRAKRKNTKVPPLERMSRYSHKSVKDVLASPHPPSEGGGYGYMTASSSFYKYIKESQNDLKQNPTPAEEKLWEYIKGKQLGYKIRRQHIIDRFVVDFVCLEKKLIIEIDGDVHTFQKERDQERTEILEFLGYIVLRFTNEEVLQNIDVIINKIKSYLNTISPLLWRGSGGGLSLDVAGHVPHDVGHTRWSSCLCRNGGGLSLDVAGHVPHDVGHTRGSGGGLSSGRQKGFGEDSSQQRAWEREYRDPQFITLNTEPQKDVIRFALWLKKDGKEILEHDILGDAEQNDSKYVPRILDLGCGNGRNLIYFAKEYNAQGIGYDFSPTAIARAREFLKQIASTRGAGDSILDEVIFCVQSIAESYTNIPDSSIDIVLDVIASNSLYEGERAFYLREVFRVLKPNGIFFVRALCLDGDRNAKNLIKEFPGPGKDTYFLPDIDLVEKTFTEKDFRALYEEYFDILFLKKHTGYQRWGNQNYKRRYLTAYLKKK